MINNLDHIGAEAIRLMTGADRDVAKAQAHIKQVWDAFTAAEEAGTTITINGVSLKKDWAKLINRTTRYCQMIAKEGDRKSQKKDANSVRPLALIKQLITVISETKDYAIVKGEAQEICDSLKWYPPAFKQENKEVKHYHRTGEKLGQKKPVKHAKHHHGTTYCGKDAHHANMARSRKHSTCPFCVAGIAANLQINHPEVMVRHFKGELKDTRSLLKHHEQLVDACLPEHRGANYNRSLGAIPECKTEIAELEAKLAIWEAVKTPEQSVGLAKQAAAEKEARRLTYEQQPVHIQSPVAGKNQTEMTLCDEEIISSFRSFEGTRMAYGAHDVATCEKCVELSKQIGLGVTETQQEERVILQPILTEVL